MDQVIAAGRGSIKGSRNCTICHALSFPAQRLLPQRAFRAAIDSDQGAALHTPYDPASCSRK
jgi:hypothetical protein